jgi:hypothetical protein
MKLVAALALAVSLAVVFAAAGCGSSSPVAPYAPPITETFSGSLVLGGSNIHVFTVGHVGDVDATITAEAPISFLPLGMILGSWDGTTCTPGYQSNIAQQGTSLGGTTTATGAFCVRIFDLASIPAGVTVTYTVVVTHP